MIRIYHWDIDDIEDEAHKESIRNDVKYKIADNGNSISIRATVPYKGESRKFKYILDVNSNKGKVLELIVTEMNEIDEIIAIPSYEYVDRTSGYNLPLLVNKNRVARVVIDEDGNVFLVLTFMCDDIDGFENVKMKVNEHTVKYYLMQDCSWYADRVDLLEKKKRLIKQTDIYRSVSYLEAQVDLLTKLVIELSDGKIDNDYLDMLKVANGYSVLDMKPKDAIVEEFDVNKANFRKAQEQYYESLK